MLKSLLFSLFAVFSYGQASVKDCNTESSFSVESVSIAPAVPIIGENMTLTLQYKVPAVVNAGIVEYKCALNGLPVLADKSDLCIATTCPITIGSHKDISSSIIPNLSGKLICSIKWNDAVGKNLLCIETTLKLSGASLRGGIVPWKENKLWPALIDDGPAPFNPARIVQKKLRPRPSAVDLAYGNQTCPTAFQKIEMGPVHY